MELCEVVSDLVDKLSFSVESNEDARRLYMVVVMGAATLLTGNGEDAAPNNCLGYKRENDLGPERRNSCRRPCGGLSITACVL